MIVARPNVLRVRSEYTTRTRGILEPNACEYHFDLIVLARPSVRSFLLPKCQGLEDLY